jgi:hypothetical protein
MKIGGGGGGVCVSFCSHEFNAPIGLKSLFLTLLWSLFLYSLCTFIIPLILGLESSHF